MVERTQWNRRLILRVQSAWCVSISSQILSSVVVIWYNEEHFWLWNGRVSQAVEDAVAGVVLHECEEAFQEVWQRQSAEDSLQKAPGRAQCALRAYRYYNHVTYLYVQYLVVSKPVRGRSRKPVCFWSHVTHVLNNNMNTWNCIKVLDMTSSSLFYQSNPALNDLSRLLDQEWSCLCSARWACLCFEFVWYLKVVMSMKLWGGSCRIILWALS